MADETTEAIFDMLNSVVIPTDQLSLRDSPASPKPPMHRPTFVQSCTSWSEIDLTSLAASDTGHEARRSGTPSEGDDWRLETIGQDSTPVPSVHFPSPPVAGCSRNDPQVTP